MTRTSILALALMTSIATSAHAQQNTQAEQSPTEQRLAAAQAAGKHTFILFTKTIDDATRAMAAELGQALAKRKSEAAWALIRVDDAAEQKIVRQCNPLSAGLPCVMVVAPNKVVTGMIPGKITDALVEEAIVTPAFAKCLLAIQTQRWAVLCVLDGEAKTLPKGVQQFTTEPGVKENCVVVAIRANNPREAKLINQLGLQPDTAGQIVLMSPTKQAVVGTFNANVQAKQLVERIAKDQSAAVSRASFLEQSRSKARRSPLGQ